MTLSTKIETFWTGDGEIWATLIVDPPEEFIPPFRETFIRMAREQSKAAGLDLEDDFTASDFPDVETHWIVRVGIDPNDPTQFRDDEEGERLWWSTEGADGAIRAIGMRFET